MNRLSEGAIELNDNEVFNNCSYSCYANIADALNILKAYEDTGLEPEEVYKTIKAGVPEWIPKYLEYRKLEEQGLLIKLPCKVEDTVYIIERCENIDTQLDGTLWDSNGGYGTATGYYCPYEDYCPHNAEDCELAKNKQAIFEDIVTGIFATEEKEGQLAYVFENCKGKEIDDFGKTIFLTREEAEKALSEVQK